MQFCMVYWTHSRVHELYAYTCNTHTHVCAFVYVGFLLCCRLSRSLLLFSLASGISISASSESELSLSLPLPLPLPLPPLSLPLPLPLPLSMSFGVAPAVGFPSANFPVDSRQIRWLGLKRPAQDLSFIASYESPCCCLDSNCYISL